MVARTQITFGEALWDVLGLAAHVAANTVAVCAETAANKLCASTSSTATATRDYAAMVDLGLFDGYEIARVAHCASPIERVGNILEHEFVVIEATLEGVARYFSLEKVNRGTGQTSTIELHEGPRISDVFHRAGTDGAPRTSPRRRLEFAPATPVQLRRVLSHVFTHMDKPFSVLNHNCQDFASEVCDLIRFAGETPAPPPPSTTAAPTPATLDAPSATAASEAAGALEPTRPDLATPADAEAAAVRAIVAAVVDAVEAETVAQVAEAAPAPAPTPTPAPAPEEDEWELITQGAGSARIEMVD